jgi:hypothetical protein
VRKDKMSVQIRREGREVHKILLRFPGDLWARLTMSCQRAGVSVNSYVINLVGGHRPIDEGRLHVRSQWDDVVSSAADLGSAIDRDGHPDLKKLYKRLVGALARLGEHL